MDSMRQRLAALQGSRVNLALDDGTRLDDCELISLSRSQRVRTAWIVRGGDDTFVCVDAISDVCEVRHDIPRAERRAA